MQNKVTVTIDDQEYTLVASEDAAYMKKVAAYVDGKIGEVKEGGRVSSTDAAVLAALNMAWRPPRICAPRSRRPWRRTSG